MKKIWLTATMVLLAVPMTAQPVAAAKKAAPKKAAPKVKANDRATKRAPSASVEPAPYHVAGSPFEGAAPAPSGGPLDRLVFGKLEESGLPPAHLCSDGVFVRRAFLDTIGTLPTAQEVRTFLADENPNKRQLLIDRLLAREEFADYWAMKWSDLLRVKSEFPINLWPNAVQAYHRWIRTCLRENLAYDQFVRQMLTASGSNFRVPQVNFYRAVQGREPQALAQAVALTFMGVRPEAWPKEKWAEMGIFFSQVSYKSTLEWKEEIVMFDPNHATHLAGGGADPQRLAAVLPDGTKVELAPDQDPRVVFADWLIDAKNPWFARNIVNRIWSWLLGRGIIHEPDDIRPDNPPSNPKLLAYLEREFVASQYDLRRIYRLILTSQTYQLSSVAKTDDPRAAAHFASYAVRRLEAEVLIDALCQITGTTEQYSSPIPEPFTFIPEDLRSIALADASITSSFLETFGRSPRDTGREAERNNRPTAAQRLHLLNSSHVQRKIEQSGKLQYLLQGKGQARDTIDDLYLTILSRFPTQEELKVVAALFQSAGTNRRTATVDLVWALLNSAEFLHRH